MKLNAVLATIKSLVPTKESRITELHHLTKKPALFNGFNKKYKPYKEGDRSYPDENQRVQHKASEIVIELTNLWTDLINHEVMKDTANMIAKADVAVHGKVLLQDIPVTSLLYLEKKFLGIRTVLEGLPTLDEAETWNKDEDSGIYKSKEVFTQRTELRHTPIVLYDATERHPAQTQLLQEQMPVGNWETVKQSGALPSTRKQVLIERLNVLIYAVKAAREQANMVEVTPEMAVGKAIFDYLLGE